MVSPRRLARTLRASSVNRDQLVDWLHRKELPQTDKLLIVLSTFQGAVPLKQVLDRAENAGLKRTKWSNPSASLRRCTGLAIHTSAGWEITKAGRSKLLTLGIDQGAPGVEVATHLRAFLARVTEPNVRSFVEEAVRCHEHRLKRSAVVMAWLAAVHVLQHWVFKKHLTSFNAELKRIGGKPAQIRTMEDFDLLKESDFLDRLSSASLLGKSRKAALKRCLDFRNNCGHPNSLKVSETAVAAHIEVLLENVFLDKDISGVQGT